MTPAGRAGTLLWAILVLIAAAVVARATYTADLSAFLPRRASATQRLLVEQLRNGPAAHLMIAAIDGSDEASRARVSLRVAARLRADPAFVSLVNGDATQSARDREFLFQHRYLLSSSVTPARFTARGLRAAIEASLAELASPAGALLKPLFVRDPTGEMLTIIDTLGAAHTPHTTAGVWSSADDKAALLLLQTRAPGSDTDAQQAACEALSGSYAAALAELPAAARAGMRLRMSGAPVFAVASRARIEGEVLRLSSVSAVLILVLLLAVYRSGRALALTLVPVASGALAGIAAVALGFGAVHGVTLGFGVTLIGEAVDYSVYLLIQRTLDFRRSVWPTIRLGMLTSICGFAALLPSAFPGLGQLGLYSITGLIAAALVTRFVLPHWLPRRLAIRDLAPAGAALARLLERWRPARAALLLVPVLAGAALYLHRGALWSRELAALSPIPAESQALDAELRAAAGAPDLRYVVIASAGDREGALLAAQALDEPLNGLVDAGVIGAFESPVHFLPALAAQRARQQSLPASAEARTRLVEALVGLPLSVARLDPFLSDVERSRTAPLLTESDLTGTSFASATRALIVTGGAGWSVLMPLSATGAGDIPDAAVAQVRAALERAGVPATELLDLKGETDRLYASYLREAIELGLAGLGAIVLLLLAALRSAARVVRVVAPLILAVLAVAGLLAAAGRPLTILHVVGMLLIVAVGSNYALFFDRSSTPGHVASLPLTLASLVVANLATVTAFGVLAFSSVPLLSDLGSTVAPGTLLALLFAALMSRPAASASVAAAAAHTGS